MVEYSPNQTFDGNTPQDLNASNLKILFAKPQDDTIRLILSGDTQRFYDEAAAMVAKANTLHNVDFLILAGDITDFGLKDEFEWIHEIMDGLNFPYIGVIGNHDIVANGDHIFQRMYGPHDFSFVYDSVKFVCHNTNSREYNFNGNVPNIDWLSNQLLPSEYVTNFIMVSHVPPFDHDFDKKLEPAYTSLLARTPGLTASFHGHLHNAGDSYVYDDGVRYINTSTIGKNQFLLIDIVNGGIINIIDIDF